MIRHSIPIRQLISLLVIHFTLGYAAIAQERTLIHDFQTTRLKSTAGTGVGSVLMDEATILNPAPLVFFDTNSVYVQRSDIDISSTNSQNSRAGTDSEQLGAIVSDANAGLSGSASLFRIREGLNKRRRLAFSMAAPLSESSSLGLTFRNTKDVLRDGINPEVEQNYNQVNLGYFQNISDALSVGAVVVDPLKGKSRDTRAIIGGQYIFKNFLTLMADAGTNYLRSSTDNLILRGAAQIKIWQDFFVRAGYFSDDSRNETGNGFGVSWVQPKLLLEFAIQNTEVEENLNISQFAEDIQETSFTLSYRF